MVLLLKLTHSLVQSTYHRGRNWYSWIVYLRFNMWHQNSQHRGRQSDQFGLWWAWLFSKVPPQRVNLILGRHKTQNLWVVAVWVMALTLSSANCVSRCLRRISSSSSREEGSSIGYRGLKCWKDWYPVVRTRSLERRRAQWWFETVIRNTSATPRQGKISVYWREWRQLDSLCAIHASSIYLDIFQLVRKKYFMIVQCLHHWSQPNFDSDPEIFFRSWALTCVMPCIFFFQLWVLLSLSGQCKWCTSYSHCTNMGSVWAFRNECILSTTVSEPSHFVLQKFCIRCWWPSSCRIIYNINQASFSPSKASGGTCPWLWVRAPAKIYKKGADFTGGEKDW